MISRWAGFLAVANPPMSLSLDKLPSQYNALTPLAPSIIADFCQSLGCIAPLCWLIVVIAGLKFSNTIRINSNIKFQRVLSSIETGGNMGSLYQLQVQGTTFFGNSGTPQIPSTTFTPGENFLLRGALAIEAPIFASNSSSSDRNVVDAGLFVGTPLDNDVQGGELQFATNSVLHQVFSSGNFSQGAAIDVSFQVYDSQTRTLTIQVDPNFAPSVQLNLFNTRSSLLSTPTAVIGGEIQIQFSEDFQRVAGSISLLGNGYIQPGQRLYQANFEGFWIENYTGVAESQG